MAVKAIPVNILLIAKERYALMALAQVDKIAIQVASLRSKDVREHLAHKTINAQMEDIVWREHAVQELIVPQPWELHPENAKV